MKKVTLILLSFITAINICYTLYYSIVKRETYTDYNSDSIYLRLHGNSTVIDWEHNHNTKYFYETNIVPLGYRKVEDDKLSDFHYDSFGCDKFYLKSENGYGVDVLFSELLVIVVGDDLYYDSTRLQLTLKDEVDNDE